MCVKLSSWRPFRGSFFVSSSFWFEYNIDSIVKIILNGLSIYNLFYIQYHHVDHTHLEFILLHILYHCVHGKLIRPWKNVVAHGQTYTFYLRFVSIRLNSEVQAFIIAWMGASELLCRTGFMFRLSGPHTAWICSVSKTFHIGEHDTCWFMLF